MDSQSPSDTLVQVTDNALDQIKRLREAEAGHAGKALRIYVECGGCSGMQYGMLFDDPQSGDVISHFPGISVLVDAHSAPLLRGAVVDWQDGLDGAGFKISNPNARQSCNCGKSFEA